MKWLCIHNITLALVKVKGHSDNTFNQHADELAKQGLIMPAFVISPDDIHFDNLALTSFHNGPTKTKSILEVDTRGFVHNLQQSTLFEQLISLKRFNPILPLHDSREINWNSTFFCLQYDMSLSSQQTSFAQNCSLT